MRGVRGWERIDFSLRRLVPCFSPHDIEMPILLAPLAPRAALPSPVITSGVRANMRFSDFSMCEAKPRAYLINQNDVPVQNTAPSV